MPNDTLAAKARAAIAAAEAVLAGRGVSAVETSNITIQLVDIREQLAADINERKTGYLDDLAGRESADVTRVWTRFNADEKVQRRLKEQEAFLGRFEELRQVNDNLYPRNLSPVLYVAGLIVAGLGEWYVNYTTFAFNFVPAVAIVATIMTAFVFAWASHVHGSYIKQMAEIIHPSVTYRQFLDRKIALGLATVLLIVFFALVLWLRYEVLASQLGLESGSEDDPFQIGSSSKVYSKLAQTAGLNFGIWALGTGYAWWCAEKIPNIREVYRDLRRVNKQVDRMRLPMTREEERIHAQFDQLRKNNANAVKEYEVHLREVDSLIKRVGNTSKREA